MNKQEEKRVDVRLTFCRPNVEPGADRITFIHVIILVSNPLNRNEDNP